MKQVVVIAALAALFCHLHAMSAEKRQAEMDEADAALNAAADARTISCRPAKECRETIRIAQAYAAERSDAHVHPIARHADGAADQARSQMRLTADIIVASDERDGAIVMLTAHCPGLLFPGHASYLACAKKVAAAYTGFRAFVESKL
jgi:bifunctional ADP-heptose synthase (sugar kinase/adenylyltransferase)